MGFDRAFEQTIGLKGGFSMDPDDNGNWTGGRKGLGVLKGTKYGISAAQYPSLDIENLTLAGAKTIYFRDYWTPLGLDRIESGPISEEVFDTGVNMGRGTAGRIVQKSVNFLEIGNPLVEDGLIGPKTFERVFYWGRKDPEAFHKALNGFQFMRYVEIVGRNVPRKPRPAMAG